MGPHSEKRVRTRNRVLLFLITVLCVSTALIGCGHDVQIEPVYIPDGKSVGAYSPPPAKCTLQLDGTVFAVDLKTTLKGEEMTIDIIAHDDVLETERYLAHPTGFSLVEASGLTCEPPIPLLTYGERVGEDHQWKGKVLDFGKEIETSADIHTSEDSVPFGGVSYRTIKIEVDLVLKIEASPSLSRKLMFWMTPEKGIIKRQFGSSTREPRI